MKEIRILITSCLGKSGSILANQLKKSKYFNYEIFGSDNNETNIKVEKIPVGYTQILFFLENQTLSNPKIIAVASNKIFSVEYSLYGANKDAKIDSI